MRRGGWKPWLAALVVAASSCGSSDVVVHKDVPYYDGPGHDAKKHLLDLYLPAGAENFPVLLFVHGGGWRHGHKDGDFNFYHRLGKGLARRGVGVAVAAYRLAPKHKFPAQAEDVARATRWVYENIGEYGGDPQRLFLCGHSAGAHLVALVALDEKYLEAEGLPPDAVAGVVGISGPYDVEYMSEEGGWFVRRYFVVPTFGDEPATWAEASAPNYARANAPPFLLIYAERDYAGLAAQAYRLAAAFAARGVQTPVHEVAGRNHLTIIYNAGKEGDATSELILDFIERR
ncbi:MAG: alpha/beta hydrolase [bacterium]